MARVTWAILFVIPLVSMHSAPVETYKTKDTSYVNGSKIIVEAVIDQEKHVETRQLPRNAVSDKARKWPQGRVPYVFSQDYSNDEKLLIQLAMKEIEGDVNSANNVCIAFVPKEPGDFNYLEIWRDNPECSSNAGFLNNGKQRSSIPKLCIEKGLVMHELLHVLGFYHEQTRYDRDSYVNINMTNANNPVNFEKAALGTQDTLNTPYDFSSIMHYGPYSMAKDRSLPVMTPQKGYASGSSFGQRLALSKMDVLRIQRLYGCQEDTSHIFHQDANKVAFCKFEKDFCSLSATSGIWKVTKDSPNGPKAGHSNGADNFLVALEKDNRNSKVEIAINVTNAQFVCIDFFFYQKGPTSFLSIEGKSPTIGGPFNLAKYQGLHFDRWQHKRYTLKLPQDSQFKIYFVAQILSGDVAIDDVDVYEEACK